MAAFERAKRDRQVERVLVGEGLANVAVMLAKAVVGFSTGSIAVLGDAVHSLADLANNIVAFIAARIASAPPDQDHPYGHKKFETLAVFGIATLLSVLAIEIILSALDRDLSTADSHAIADEIERAISEKFSVNDVTVHIEPHSGRTTS